MTAANFCWYGSSLRSAAAAIAVFDLLIVAVPLTFEATTAGFFLGVVAPIAREKCTILGITDDGLDIVNCTWNNSNNSTGLNDYAALKAETYSVTILIAFILLGAVIEGYLFSTLRRGVHERIHHWVKRWVSVRLVLLVITVGGSVGKFLLNNYNIYVDGLVDLVKVYRVLALVVVCGYMRELERTVGVFYIPPVERPKKGSLGQDIHLLD